MTEDERIEQEVKRRIEQRDLQRSEFEVVAKNIFRPMDNFLEQYKRDNLAGKVSSIDTKVDVITTHQRTQGREIKELKGKVDGLSESMTGVKERVAAMPGEWGKDIQTAVTVESDRTRQDVSGLINTAEAKGRAEAERLATEAKRKDSFHPPRSNNRAIAIMQTYLPYILMGLAAIGAVSAALNGSTDEVQIQKAVESSVKKTESEQMDNLRKLIQAAVELPPTSFDPKAVQPVTEYRSDVDAGP